MKLFFSLLFIAAAKLATASHLPLADTVKNKFSGPGNPYTAPPASVSRLFFVQRSPNSNTIIYSLNLDKSGVPNEDEPVHAYWIRYNEKGQKEDLSYIQRKFAYGLNAKPLGNGKYDIRFVAYKKFPLTLMKGNDGKYHIFVTISQKQIVLNQIFVKIEGGTFWVPNVRFVEVKGVNAATGKEVVERFKP